MRRKRGFTRWGVLGTACLLLLGGAGTATGGTPTTPSQVLFGPVGIFEDDRRTVLSVTNLTAASGRPTLTFFDEDGAVLKRRRPVVEPGKTATLSFRSEVVPQFWGRVVIPSGSPNQWAPVMHILGQPSHPVVLTLQANTVHADTASSALRGEEWRDIGAVDVVNLGSAPASFTVSLVDASGACLAQTTIPDVPPGAIGSAFVAALFTDLRVQVDSPSGTPFVASAETKLQDGTLIEHADIRYPSIIIVVC